MRIWLKLHYIYSFKKFPIFFIRAYHFFLLCNSELSSQKIAGSVSVLNTNDDETDDRADCKHSGKSSINYTSHFEIVPYLYSNYKWRKVQVVIKIANPISAQYILVNLGPKTGSFSNQLQRKLNNDFPLADEDETFASSRDRSHSLPSEGRKWSRQFRLLRYRNTFTRWFLFLLIFSWQIVMSSFS